MARSSKSGRETGDGQPAVERGGREEVPEGALRSVGAFETRTSVVEAAVVVERRRSDAVLRSFSTGRLGAAVKQVSATGRESQGRVRRLCRQPYDNRACLPHKRTVRRTSHHRAMNP